MSLSRAVREFKTITEFDGPRPHISVEALPDHLTPNTIKYSYIIQCDDSKVWLEISVGDSFEETDAWLDDSFQPIRAAGRLDVTGCSQHLLC